MVDLTPVHFLLTEGNAVFKFLKGWAKHSPYLSNLIRQFEENPDAYEGGLIPLPGITVASFHKMAKHLSYHAENDNVVITNFDRAMVTDTSIHWLQTNAHAANLLGLHAFEQLYLDKIEEHRELANARMVGQNQDE